MRPRQHYRHTTPAGCMIGLAGVFCSVFALLGALGMWRWMKLPIEARQYDRYFWTMLCLLVGGTLITVILTFLAVRSVKNKDSDIEDYY